MAANTSAESTFRSQLSGEMHRLLSSLYIAHESMSAGFRWAQGRTDDSAANANTGGGYLSTITNSISGYVPLRSAERSNEEEAYLSLSRWERCALHSPYMQEL